MVEVSGEREANRPRAHDRDGSGVVRDGPAEEAEAVRDSALVEQIMREGFNPPMVEVHAAPKVDFAIARSSNKRSVGTALGELRRPFADVVVAGTNKSLDRRSQREVVISVKRAAP